MAKVVEEITKLKQQPGKDIIIDGSATLAQSLQGTGLIDEYRFLVEPFIMGRGRYTHYCVNQTVYDAYAYDFIPGVVTDAVISNLPDEAALMLARMARNGYHLLTTEEVVGAAAQQR